MRAGKQGKAFCRSGSGNEEVRTRVAMVMMPADVVARLALIVGRVAMMVGMIVMAVMHGINRETAEAVMFMCHHQRGGVLQLIGCLRGQGRRIEHHERDAERRDQAMKSGGDRCEHGPACNCASCN